MIDVRGAWDRARTAAGDGLRLVFSRRARPFWIAGAGLCLAGAVLTAVGAFDGIEPEPVEVPVGEEVRLPTYAVTVLDAEVTDAVEEQFLEADAGEALLLVTMRLENLSDRTIGVDTSPDLMTSRLVNASSPLIELTGVTATRSARIWRDVDSPQHPLLQPGVPAEITVAWPVDSAELREGSPALEIHEAEVSTGRFIVSSDAITWMQGDAVARIELEPAR